MTLKQTGPVVAFLALAAALVAGCGSGGGSSGTTAASTISKTDFVAQANAICAKGNKATSADGAKLKNLSNADAKAEITNTFVPDVQQQIDAITALGAPAGDESTVSSMLALAQDDLDKLKANPNLIGQPDLFSDFAKQAHPYGMTECAKGS